MQGLASALLFAERGRPGEKPPEAAGLRPEFGSCAL